MTDELRDVAVQSAEEYLKAVSEIPYAHYSIPPASVRRTSAEGDRLGAGRCGLHRRRERAARRRLRRGRRAPGRPAAGTPRAARSARTVRDLQPPGAEVNTSRRPLDRH